MAAERERLHLRIYLLLFFAVLLLGTFGFMATEGLTLGDALYFSIVTVATVGYGDISPVSAAGKLITVILIFTGAGTFLGVVANGTELLLNRREGEKRRRKLQMVFGLFFSEAGNRLLGILAQADPRAEEIAGTLGGDHDWSPAAFASARRATQGHAFGADPRRIDLEELEKLLQRHGRMMVGLIENPYLLEHEAFTDLLIAIFHLREELHHRPDFADLPQSDLDHLGGDLQRVYALLTRQWLDHLQHLKGHYPFLFSLALRTNPFDKDASPVVR